MNFFNTDKLTQGKAKVDTIFDSADRLGLDIIRVNHKKPGAHISGFSGFEVPKVTTDHSGMNFDVIVEKGMFHCYPDKMLNRHGFVLDTEHNRDMLKSYLSSNMIKVLDAKLREELINEAQEEGRQVSPIATVSQYQPSSPSTKSTKSQIASKERRAANHANKEKSLQEEIEYLKEKLANQEAKDINKNNTTVEYQEVNEETGEITTVVEKAEAPAEVKSKKTGPKPGTKKKPLAGKTAKK